MMALLYEIVSIFIDAWIECLREGRLPQSQEHILASEYITPSMMALLYEASCWTYIKTQYQRDRPSTDITLSIMIIEYTIFPSPLSLDCSSRRGGCCGWYLHVSLGRSGGEYCKRIEHKLYIWSGQFPTYP